MSKLQNNHKPLSVTNPKLLSEWDYDKNAPLSPNDVTKCSNKKVWWKCEKGHEWQAAISDRHYGTGCPYCSGRRVLQGFNDLATLYPEIATEWDYDRNSSLLPEEVSAGSNKKVWWKCKLGHSYEKSVFKATTAKERCPFCSNHSVLSGFNDLATTHPKIAKEWNYDRNSHLTPSEVLAGSHKKVWWKCSSGHEWQAMIDNRTRHGHSCPYCCGHKAIKGVSDLSSLNSSLAKEWNYEKNGALSPNDVKQFSGRKVWWKCEKGHEWKVSVANRSLGNGCPYCAGQFVIKGSTDLATKNPTLTREWNYDKNYPLIPEQFSVSSRKKVWWKCSLGHEWQANICDRNNGNGCPYCSNRKVLVGYNDLASQYPEIASEWNYKKNDGLKPENITYSSPKRIWWICNKGHEWKTAIYNRFRGSECPFCSNNGSSMPEQGIAFYLSKCFEVEQRIRINKQEIDVYLPQFKVGIEYDGYYYHKDKSKHDQNKTDILKKAGIRLIRVVESDNNNVIEDIVYYNYDNLRNNYEWAINSLLRKVSCITGNRDVNSISVNITRDRLLIRERFALVRKKNSLANNNPQLVKEWNTDKNGILSPDMFDCHSGEPVWWKCEKGHEWKAVIASRSSGNGCPYCANQKLLVGYNDLASKRPELIKEWNYEKNGNLMPQDVLFGSDKKVWWICPKGHEWATKISARSRGSRCPYCLGLKLPPILCVETGQIFDSARQASKQTGASNSGISKCCKGRAQSAGGYHWKFINEE